MKNLFHAIAHIAYDRYVGQDKVEEMIHRSENTIDVECEVVGVAPLAPLAPGSATLGSSQDEGTAPRPTHR